MENKKIIELSNISSSKKIKKLEYKIYTPDMVKRYKSTFKIILKMTNNRNKTLFIMYKKVKEWYEQEEDADLNIEKIHINTKLGSYTSGGCGIGASLFAGLLASGVFSYIDNYVSKLGTTSLIVYVISTLFFGFKILSNEDDKVEMYNMFLEVLNTLEEHKAHSKK